MKLDVSRFTSIVLLIMAASSFMSMLFLLRIDGIINGDLYRYGLRFSGEWAVPYWTMALSIFGIGWFNIISAIALQVYMTVSERREARITRITSRRNEAPKSVVPTVQKAVIDEKAAIERARELAKEIGTPVESQVLGLVGTETEAQKGSGEAEPDRMLQKQAQEAQSTGSIDGEKPLGEVIASREGLEQKTGSREEGKDALVSVDAGVVGGSGLTDAEELIYSCVEAYFYPSTRGRSFRTDFPDRVFVQRELKRLYFEKKLNKDDYVNALIKAFPAMLEEDVSDKLLDYLEGRLQHMSNTQDSLAIVRECRRDREKWNALWKKICQQYESELQQEALTA